MQEDNESIVTATSPDQTVAAQNSPPAASAKESLEDPLGDGFINNNRRHKSDFNKHKSSDAMKTLLNAQQQDENKQKLVANGIQIINQSEFESRKAGGSG